MQICNTCRRKYNPSSRHKDCPKCRAEKAKTPCVKCGKSNGYKHKKCINCHNGSGSESPSWKGGKTHHHKGYVMHWIKDRKYVFDHVLVMEELMGRRLFPKENVHHKNGVKDDNRPENLELWTRPQPVGIRVSDVILCAQEVLERYAPELLNGCNTNSSENGIRTGESMPPTSTSV